MNTNSCSPPGKRAVFPLFEAQRNFLNHQWTRINTKARRSFAICRQSRGALFFAPMKLRLVVEHDARTKRWAAFFPELPGCASAGDTEDEAIQNAKEALELWFEPAPVDLPAGAKVLEVALT